MTRSYTLLINGQSVAGSSTFPVMNPATEKRLALCPKASMEQLNQAVAAAKAAFPVWSATPVEERAARLDSLIAALETRADEFAALLTAEQGKPLDQAMFEVIGSTFVLRAFRHMRVTDRILRDDADSRIIEHRTPLGVVAAITPWNFPLILLMNKLGPALITGNTVVVKPAPTTPLTTLLFGELCGAHLPAGVVNVICDENDLGSALTAHPDVSKIAFTGSTATGRIVMASAAKALKRVTLELGGNDAAIVLDDVDPKVAARKVYESAMANAGQICVATKRAYVPTQLYDAFCDEIARLANEAVVDDGANQGSQIGPIQNRAQYEKVLRLIEDSKQRGNVIAGGQPLERDGFFIPPTIVRDLPDDAALVREEQFGPVLPVMAYDDIDELVGRVNASEFGLGGTVWGRDLKRAGEIARRIDSGTVWVNQYLAIDPNIPFRGAKQSGLGSELGEAGLYEYTQAHIVNSVALT